ncbi:MAG TPA: gamma-glutamylcyclotransferase family protein [Kofleriaceae bacterium]|nr:gamma-glutamylcyclotransferase family protein [Kofleriaceae bacterium]
MAVRKRRTGSFEVERTTGSHDVLDRLFVYGTLRQGQTARSLLANSVKKSTPAWTSGQIYAFPMGYPGFSDADARGRVVGEVVWLTDLAATFGLLDAYEGEDFARVIKQVTTASGEQLWAWIYTLADPAATQHGTLIGDGDWVRYWTEQT